MATAQTAPTATDLAHQALDAMGGEARLRSLHTVSFKGMMHRNALEQSIRPEGPWFLEYSQITESRDLDKNRLRDQVESRGYSTEWWHTAEWERSTVIVADGVAAQAGADGKLAPGRTAIVEDAEESLAFGPERALLAALAAGDLHREADAEVHGFLHPVISFHQGKTAVRVLINPVNKYPAAVELTRTRAYNTYWSPWGDITTRIDWDLWVLETNGLHYPHQWTYVSNGLPERTISIQEINFNPAVQPSAFDIPAEVKTAALARRRTLEEIPFGREGQPPVEAAPGIWQVAGNWNVEEIKQPDGVVILEGPISNGYSSKTIEDAQKRFPGLRVKAVITTSDSWPHIGGLREYMERGIEIYALDLNRPIIERLAASPHTIEPDALAKSPKKPKFHIVSMRTKVGTGPTRMEIIPLRTVSGERQMIVYFPESRVLYTSDLFAKLPDGTFWLPQYLSELKSVVEREHLDVQAILGMHYGPTPWSDFMRALNASSETAPLLE